MLQECNDFVEGNMLLSARSYRALDETGIFGYCCWHEFPHRFLNLIHGERYAYYHLFFPFFFAMQCKCVSGYKHIPLPLFYFSAQHAWV